MSYLERRVRYLLDELRAGHLILPASPESDDLKQAIQELRTVRQRPDGHIDLSSCSDRVRSLARMFYMLRGLPEGPEHPAGPAPSPEPIHDTVTRQRELFALFDEFFRRATGLPPEKFAELGH